MDTEIQRIASTVPYAERVAHLRCFRGIDYLTALAFVSEVGDFRRFASAPAFMAFLGLVPSERSSGSRRWQGAITKAGNGHLRCLLVEAAWHYNDSDFCGRDSPPGLFGQEIQPPSSRVSFDLRVPTLPLTF